MHSFSIKFVIKVGHISLVEWSIEYKELQLISMFRERDNGFIDSTLRYGVIL